MTALRDLEIKKTERTPGIYFNQDEMSLSISGISMPENTPSFYQPIFSFCDELIAESVDRLKVNVALVHFNSSSTKALFTVFRKIDKLAEKADVNITWYCDEDDEDMIEIVEDFTDILDIEINVEMISDVADEI